MRIGCFSDEIAPGLDDQIRVIRDLEIHYLEIRSVDDTGVLDLDEERLEAIRRQCDENRFTITCVSSPIGKNRADVDMSFCEDQMRRACRAADILGCEYIRIFSFFIGDLPFRKAFDLSLARLRILTAMAEEHHKVLVMEGGKDTVGQTADVAIRLFREVSSPALRCAFDMAALLAAGDDPFGHSLPVLKEFVSYIHIKDMKVGAADRVPAGQGDAKVAQIINEFRDSDLVLSLEPHLAYAGAVRGFSGETNFRIAYAALVKILKDLKISYS